MNKRARKLKSNGNTPSEINLRIFKKLSQINSRILKYRWWLYESEENKGKDIRRMDLYLLGLTKFAILKKELREQLISNN